MKYLITPSYMDILLEQMIYSNDIRYILKTDISQFTDAELNEIDRLSIKYLRYQDDPEDSIKFCIPEYTNFISYLAYYNDIMIGFIYGKLVETNYDNIVEIPTINHKKIMNLMNFCIDEEYRSFNIGSNLLYRFENKVKQNKEFGYIMLHPLTERVKRLYVRNDYHKFDYEFDKSRHSNDFEKWCKELYLIKKI